MVKLGIYPEDWAGDVRNDGGDFGERPVDFKGAKFAGRNDDWECPRHEMAK